MGAAAAAGPANAAAAPPQRVGRYRVQERIGKGSGGVVHRAVDIIIGRHVALKMLPSPGRGGGNGTVSDTDRDRQDDADRFLREAKAAGQIAHPNVVTVFEVGGDTDAGLLYIAMELVEGETVQQMLRRKHGFDFDAIRHIGGQVAAALGAAHERKVVHRDIKPANLMLTAAGTVKVVDFGIARLDDSRLTRAGSILGSPGYMSPEQIRGLPVDFRSDLFSLGAVLYEMCTLRRAFPATDLGQLFKALMTCQPVPVKTLRPDIPEDLERVITRALSRDPVERFASAGEMAEALTPPPIALPVPVPAAASPEPDAPGTTTVRRLRKRFRLGWTAGAVTTTLVGMPVVFLALTHGRGHEASSEALDAPAQAPAPAPAADTGAPMVAVTASRGEALEERRNATPAVAPATAPAPRPGPPAASKKLHVASATVTLPVPAKDAGREDPTVAALRPAYELPVVHRHRFGSCNGTLRILSDRIEYAAPDHDQDSVAWPYPEMVEARVEGDRVRLVQSLPGANGRRKRATLELRTDDPGAAAAMAYVRARLNAPSR